MFRIVTSTENLSSISLPDLDQIRKRKQTEILVIDDQGFSYKDYLERLHYSIRHEFDVDDIRNVEPYSIVLCDIFGVGKKLGLPREGAHLIDEIHSAYPSKILIGYSTHNLDPSYSESLKKCDFIANKDTDSDGWQTILNAAITNATDPIQQWKRMREFLLRSDVPIFDVFRLEQDYIRSLNKKRVEIFSESSVLRNLKADARAVIQGFIANLIFKLLIPS
jgi:hypothetical protein